MLPSVETALALLQRGEITAALTAFEGLIASRPNDVAVLSAHASALRLAGRIDEALAQLRKARDYAPDDPGVCFNHANALRAAGQLDAAEQAYRRAVQFAPNLAPAWVNLGVLYQDQRRFEAAEQAYTAALQIDPQQATAAMNRGNCLRQLGRLDEAIAQHRRAIELAPRSAQAHYNLGNALRDANGDDEAIRAWRTALQGGPASLTLWTRLGFSLQELGDSESALAAFDRGRREHPQVSQAHCNYGHMALRLRQPREGVEALRRAVQLEPGEPIATSHLVDALIRNGFLSEAIALARPALSMAQARTDSTKTSTEESLARLHNVLGHAHVRSGELDKAMVHLEEAKRLRPDASSISNLLFSSLYREDIGAIEKAELHQQETTGFRSLRSSRGRAEGQEEPNPASELPAPDASINRSHRAAANSSPRRLRIGYLSADLCEHPVGFFMQPLLRQHDRTRFEVFVYCDVESPDALTGKLQLGMQHWVNSFGYSDDELARRMRADGIDVLIELSGHTSNNRLPLFAQRVAPVQVSYLGYPFSTGLAEVDAMLGDAVTTPSSDAAVYREQVLRLPHFPFCIQPHATAPPVAPLPALRNGHITFGCFNDLAKVGPATLALWARLLRAVPDARLQLRALGLNDPPTCARILGIMSSHGVDRTRLDLLQPVQPIAAYLEGYGKIDIALDPIAYNGGTTSFEALWQGVPVLTIAGSGFCARMGAGINATAGLDDFTARDQDHFLALAKSWSTRREDLAALRANQRERLAQTPLFNASLFMPGYERALSDIAQRAIDKA